MGRGQTGGVGRRRERQRGAGEERRDGEGTRRGAGREESGGRKKRNGGEKKADRKLRRAGGRGDKVVGKEKRTEDIGGREGER